jgi:hypothetical protein
VDERSVEDLLSFINGGNEGTVLYGIVLMHLYMPAGNVVVMKALPPSCKYGSLLIL